MKKHIIESEITVCQPEELDAEARLLIEAAIEATHNSYAPYSRFHVGAALRLQDGTTVKGANQENAAFPVTICGERTAIFAAHAQYPGQAITAIAIAAANDGGLTDMPVTPCGSCRQAMLEAERRQQQPLTIYLYGTKAVYVVHGIRTLLPLAFVDEDMR